ncbi:hypothetical protein BC332_24367 [Capsicum chinense]|nr:hypothetical protein BC332_24367 [Capsicum chinense]
MDTQTKNPNCQSDEASTRYGFDCPPQEIVVDIASSLPITSLRQFYFVQKSFYNLSRDPELVNLHISRAVRNDPCIIISMDCDLLYFLEFSDLGMEDVMRKINTPFERILEFDWIGSCHGLLCFCDSVFRDALYVYNPFTRDWCELSQSAEFWGHTDFVFGFGFSPTTNEYKVILIVHNRPEYHSDEIFGEVPIVNFGVDPRIVQFQLVVFGDCITVAITLPHENGEGLDIWVMRECNVKESWIKEFIMLGKAMA